MEQLAKLPLNFESLPNDILRELLKKLDWESAKNYCLTNKKLKGLCNGLWRTRALEEFDIDINKNRKYKDEFYEYLRLSVVQYANNGKGKVSRETAESMAMELARYLRERYPNEFKLRLITLERDEQDLSGYLIHRGFHDILPDHTYDWDMWEKFEKEHSINRGDLVIGVNYNMWAALDFVFFHSPDKDIYSLWLWKPYELTDSIPVPLEFSKYITNMGLTLKAAEYLYGLSNIKPFRPFLRLGKENLEVYKWDPIRGEIPLNG